MMLLLGAVISRMACEYTGAPSLTTSRGGPALLRASLKRALASLPVRWSLILNDIRNLVLSSRRDHTVTCFLPTLIRVSSAFHLSVFSPFTDPNDSFAIRTNLRIHLMMVV